MKKFEHLTLVEFSFYQALDLPIVGNTAILGPNGCGKSTILDAIQIALTGGVHLALNAKAEEKTRRSIRAYVLGEDPNTQKDGAATRLRENGLSYVSLTFRDERTGAPVSFGACMTARSDTPKHETELFVVKGAKLTTADFIERIGPTSFRPVAWKDFQGSQRAAERVEAHRKFEAARDNATKYIGTYLNYLEDPTASIDPKRYRQTLRESLHLR